MIIFLVVIIVLIVVISWYMRQPKFGIAPKGERLEQIKQSPHYKNGKFENLSPTPALAEGQNIFTIFYNNFFKHHPRRTPQDIIPSVKTDLSHLPADANVLVWFGHSSYFIQLYGKRILVDPVFSGHASPLPGTVKSFKGTDIYTVDDLPEIDFLFITHDHYDHVDYDTLIALKDKVGKVICGLGVGAHFEYWGYAPDNIVEKDWYQQVELDTGFTAFVEPARHFSGRKFSRNNTLWVSYVLQTPGMKIYLGGDSGYDTHFAAIGNKYGPIDLAILENGQYNAAWKYIHNLPEDVLKAARDLKAVRVFPVHSSKFALSTHPWDEPLLRITAGNNVYHIPLVTPMIGEPVDLNNENQVFKPWWLGIN